MTTIDGKLDQWDFEAEIDFRPADSTGLEPMHMTYTVPASGLEESKGNAVEAFREHVKQNRNYAGIVKSENYDLGLQKAAVEFKDGSYLTVQSRLL